VPPAAALPAGQPPPPGHQAHGACATAGAVDKAQHQHSWLFFHVAASRVVSKSTRGGLMCSLSWPSTGEAYISYSCSSQHVPPTTSASQATRCDHQPVPAGHCSLLGHVAMSH
jgi:hypothetical protein